MRERKGPYLAFKKVDIFVDDMLQYVEDIRESGVPVLHFVKEVHICPKKLLEREGYLSGLSILQQLLLSDDALMA